MNAAAVAAAVAGARLGSYGNEDDLQVALAAVLGARWPVEREKRLVSGRIDLLVAGTVGVEAKVAESASAVLRRLRVYAADARITGLVLVTTRYQHRGLPDEVDGKPLRVVWLPPL